MRPLGKVHGALASEIYRIPFDGVAAQLPTNETVGSKAHNLMRLAGRALPVPPAFVLGTEVCRDYLRNGAAALNGLDALLDTELDALGRRTGRYLGDAKRPLLLSVRSGAAVSMPGMMETVLNVGLNDVTLRALIRMTGNPHLAFDCRRRLVQQYGEVVHAIAPVRFAARQKALLGEMGAGDVDELDTSGLKRIADAFAEEFQAATGERFPSDPRAQLRGAIEAVLRSWSSPRAQSYRKLNGISDQLGTAVTVQAMVFGNLSPASGSGVGFTRNPADGSNELYVDYLSNAQGEDVVAGRRRAMGLIELERRAPAAFRSLIETRTPLEQEFGDMQDFEFTVEEDRLFLLQSRTGKRTPLAAARIACDLVEEGLISAAQALSRIEGVEVDAIETVRLMPVGKEALLARGTPASAGVAIGAVVFDPERAAALKRRGKPVILVRETAETSDIGALSEAAALVTAEGARTSHAAVVARQLGKGELYLGELEVVRERPSELLANIARWRGVQRSGGKRRPPLRRATR